MSGQGKALKLDQVSVGARLATDLLDPGGHVLLSAGAELTASALQSLRQRGVTQVQIEEELDEVGRALRRRAVTQRLAELFRAAGDDPLMNRLHEAVLAYRMEQMK